MSERNIIELETGWEFMHKGITKLKNIMEGILEQHFSSETLQFRRVHNALHVSLEIKTLRITQLSMELDKSQKEILLQLNAFDELGEKASF